MRAMVVPLHEPPPPPDSLRQAQARLAEAIHARHALHLLYDEAWRVVHPHALGRTGRGKLALLAWQTAGDGRSGGPEGWRLFDLGRIEAAEVLQARFTPRRKPESGQWTIGLPQLVAAVRG